MGRRGTPLWLTVLVVGGLILFMTSRASEAERMGTFLAGLVGGLIAIGLVILVRRSARGSNGPR